MRIVKLKTSKTNIEWLKKQSIDINYLSSFFSLILTQLRPCMRSTTHILRLEILECEYSQYAFSNVLYICRNPLTGTTGSKLRQRLLEDMLHEFGHYIQFVIDKVNINTFAIDHLLTTYTTYFRNKTETQARTLSKFAKEYISLYNKLRSMQRFLTKIENGKRTKSPKSQKRKDSKTETDQSYKDSKTEAGKENQSTKSQERD